MRQVFTWVGQERLSIGEVCRRLTAAGVPTRSGKPVWDRTVVWAMLKNPAYIGQAAFGKTRAGPYTPQQVRAQRGRPAQPRHAATTTDVPAAEWLSVPVPPLVDEALFAAVQEQLAENRRHARQQQRGAHYLLQGLVVCAACGYAYYGKAISPSAAKGKARRYAYYRCLGTDAYRFGGERVCANSQVRTDRLDEAVWQAVRELLEQPERLVAEYQRRLEQPTPGADDLAGLEGQLAKLRQGLGRLIDSYAEGVIEKGEFEPRIRRLRQRIEQLEAQARHLRDDLLAHQELRLLVGQVETFAAQVHAGLDTADWLTCREVIRAVVKRVEVERDQVKVVFRVPPGPFARSPETGILPDCRRRQQPAAVGTGALHRWRGQQSPVAERMAALPDGGVGEQPPALGVHGAGQRPGGAAHRGARQPDRAADRPGPAGADRRRRGRVPGPDLSGDRHALHRAGG